MIKLKQLLTQSGEDNPFKNSSEALKVLITT